MPRTNIQFIKGNSKNVGHKLSSEKVNLILPKDSNYRSKTKGLNIYRSSLFLIIYDIPSISSGVNPVAWKMISTTTPSFFKLRTFSLFSSIRPFSQPLISHYTSHGNS